MVLAPFHGKDKRKTFSLVSMIVGLIIVMFTAPFTLKTGGYAIASSAVGGTLVLVGLIYFIDIASWYGTKNKEESAWLRASEDN